MKISSLGEFGLIERIRRTEARDAKGVRVGIGDDAAALLLSPASTLLATTDMLLEGVHFDLGTTDLFSLGWKSAAVNVSDIAAMGGTPRFCLTSLGIPSVLTVEDIGEFYRGLNACLKKSGSVLAGGDTCRSPKGFVISVTLLGEADRDRMVTRAGAKPGDVIYVTGTLGDAGAGLELVRSAECGVRSRTPAVRKLIERHLRPIPRVAEGRMLASIASAMIDVSDGLSSDLGHICGESGVGAEIFAGKVPLSKGLRALKTLQRPALEYALSGGEDYELLFTVPQDKLRRFRSKRLDATELGVITRGRAVTIIGASGRKKPLQPSGYDHFGVQARDKRPRR